MQIVDLDINELIPYARNARTHSDEQVAQIAGSIKEFGFTNPVLIDGDGGIIAGHGRVLAARKLGLSVVPVIKLDHLTETQKRAYILADNKLALNAGWDDEMLKLELEDLNLLDFDMDLIGFSEDEFDLLMDGPETIKEGLTDDDEVPEIPAEPITKKGDVWLLGNHRVMCGDSTSIDAVEKLMAGNKADMVFTSPPYNADTHFSTLTTNIGKLYSEGYKDNLKSNDYVDFCIKVLSNCFLVTNGFIFWNVNYNSNSKSEYIKQVIPFLDKLIEQICWKKSSVIPYRSTLRRQWEPIYLFSTNNNLPELGLKETVSNHWEINNANSQIDSHRGCFPAALPCKALELLPNALLVFEPFGGSGTTLIACEKTNRNCYTMELDEKYCDVIVRRWQEFTGKEATLESTGLTFNAGEK